MSLSLFRRSVRLLRFLLIGLFFLAVIAFAANNRAYVALSLSPLPWEIALPVYLLALGALIAGACLGYFTAARRLWRLSRLLHHSRNRVRALEEERSPLPPVLYPSYFKNWRQRPANNSEVKANEEWTPNS